MGGSKPVPMAGRMMNEQFAQQINAARDQRMRGGNPQAEEMFQTLMSTGQQPYRSPYEPEDLYAPMSSQNPEPFDYKKFFDTNKFG